MTLPGSSGSQTVKFDPSWKFRDFQSGIPGFDLLTTTKNNRQFDTTDYYSTTRKESAAEYYEDKVREYLSTNYPDKSLADIAFDGPIHPQTIRNLSLTLPYTVVSQHVVDSTEQLYTLNIQLLKNTDILFDWSHSVWDICLSRLTITPNLTNGGTYAQPELLLDGVHQAIISSPILSSTKLTLKITLTSPSPVAIDSYTATYERTADRYIAIGLDANQISDQMLVKQRQVVNREETAHVNGQSVNLDSEIGGLLNLAISKFFHDADEGEQAINGLTHAVPYSSYVACGIASSKSSFDPVVANLQFPYLPSGMGLDVPANCWKGISIYGVDLLNPAEPDEDLARYTIMGYHNSSMEGLVLEELTNYDSISTMKAFQIAHKSNLVTINSSNILSYSSYWDPTHNIYNRILDYVNTKNFTVQVPTTMTTIGSGANPNPQGSWTGVGYTITNTYGYTVGYMIQGSNDTAAHGGGAWGNKVTPTIPIINPNTFSSPDPINTANGNVTHDETDISLPNLGMPLDFSRHYDSFNTVPWGIAPWSDRGMGEGWSFSYSDRLIGATKSNSPPLRGKDITWFTSGGIQYTFTYSAATGYTAPVGLYGTFTDNGISPGYTWEDNSGNLMKFDDFGKLLYINDRYGNGITVGYDDVTKKKIDTVADAKNPSRKLTFTYQGNHIHTITDFSGRFWTYDYDAKGRLMRVFAPKDSNTLPAITQYDYYDDDNNAATLDGPALAGLLKSVSDPNGDITRYAYYANRRGFKVTNAEGNEQSLSYNLYRNSTAFTDERGNTTYTTYESDGNPRDIVTPDRAKVSYEWYSAGATGQGLKKSETDAYGQKESYEYNSKGNLTKFTDRLLQSTYYAYYASSPKYNNLQTLTKPDSGTTTYYYSDTGTGAPNNDGKSLWKITQNDGTHSYTTINDYDWGTNRGLVKETTDPMNNKTSYTYNSAGQMTSRTSHPDSSSSIIETFVYDNNFSLKPGFLTSTTDGNGNTTTYTYDLLGRRLSQTLPDPDGSCLNLSVQNTTYTYDAIGNLTKTAVFAGDGDIGDMVLVNSAGVGEYYGSHVGFIMYSQEDVHVRFAGHPPEASKNAHFVDVKYESGQWWYQQDYSTYYPFTPSCTDILVSILSVGFPAPTMLKGVNSSENGIAKGYADGDLNFTYNAPEIPAPPNTPLILVSGTYFVPNGGLQTTGNLRCLRQPEPGDQDHQCRRHVFHRAIRFGRESCRIDRRSRPRHSIRL